MTRASDPGNDLAGLDVEAVNAWLEDRVPELTPPVRFQRAWTGRSNLTFLGEDSFGRGIVLRRPPLGPLLATAHDMAREFRIQTCLSAVGLPIARPLAMCDDDTVSGAPFYVMERVSGAVVSSLELGESLAIEVRARSGTAVAETLAQLHAADVDEIGLGGLARRESYVERQIARWRGQWEQSKTREITTLDRLSTRLAATVPPQRESSVVHGDYNLANVMLTADGSVAAVLDWELCTLGEPLADLGILVAYWADHASTLLPGVAPVTTLPGFCSQADLVERYAHASRRDVSHLGYFEALAYWRHAIIIQGVYRRWLEAPSNGRSDAGELGDQVDRCVELALDAAARAGL